jgi:hypothetical protein
MSLGLRPTPCTPVVSELERTEALTVAKLAGVAAVTAGVLLLATDGSASPRATCAETVALPADPPLPSPTHTEHDR